MRISDSAVRCMQKNCSCPILQAYLEAIDVSFRGCFSSNRSRCFVVRAFTLQGLMIRVIGQPFLWHTARSKSRQAQRATACFIFVLFPVVFVHQSQRANPIQGEPTQPLSPSLVFTSHSPFRFCNISLFGSFPRHTTIATEF
ncbi:hypothetical protein K440DRAFT_87536 [Wilcoxina mikolae CBS 423.85]|nr:hypothetical protein K440DRAFT_87536 [Wilcoxina mikolae CBS 423.85]